MTSGCAGALLAFASRQHSRSCQFFISTRPSFTLHSIRRPTRETFCHPPSCRVGKVGKHLAAQAGRTEQGVLASSNAQSCSRTPVSSNLSAAAGSGQDDNAGLMPVLGRRILSTLTAAALALAILFSSTPTAYAAAFPFAPRVSSTPATLEMKVMQFQVVRNYLVQSRYLHLGVHLHSPCRTWPWLGL